MAVPDSCAAAVFDGVGKPLRMERFDLGVPPPGHILAKVRMTTICGSDLHTVFGRRIEPTPLILGHEVVAQVEALGEGVTQSAGGEPCQEGDRITFTIMAACGDCPQCRSDMPQKCDSLFKYGHTSCNDAPPLSGGLAEYIVLRPGTAVFHVPSGLPDAVVCPANCALATVVNALEAISVRPGERVWVLGAGLLGLYATALLADMDAGEVIVSDVNNERLQMAEAFGAHRIVNVDGMTPNDVAAIIGETTCDCAVEVCGEPAAVPPAVRALRLRGRCVLVGLVFEGADFTIDGNTVTRNYVTLTGVHNYAPRHLKQALDFLERTAPNLPYEDLVPRTVPLWEVKKAFYLSKARAGIRIGVVPQT